MEKDFCSTGEVSESVVERELQKISKYKIVNQSYITDCINDAKKRHEQHGSVVQSYTLGNRMVTQEIILNIAIVSNHD